MKLFFAILILINLSCCTSSNSNFDQVPSPEKNSTWDLTDLFENETAWQSEIDKISSDMAKLKSCKGRLAKSAKDLFICLDRSTQLGRRLRHVSQWGSLQSSTDGKNPKFSEYSQKSSNLWSKFGQARSFIEPELVKIPRSRLKRFIARDKRLKDYDHYIYSLLRTKRHTLTETEENLLSMFSPVIWGANSRALLSSDIKWNQVTTSSGKKLLINPVEYANSRGLAERDDRLKVYQAFYGKLSQFEKSFGENLYQNIKARVTTAKARKYKSALQSKLSGENIPEQIYTTLVEQVNANLPILHRYLEVKRKLLGISKMKYHDMYREPLDLNKKFSIAKSKQIALETLKPFGERYLSKLRKGFSNSWMHMYPAPSKRGGAYVSGNYDTHPYVFLNHQNTLDSLSTFTHEWGHAVHSMLADEAQPYSKADYDILTAELASIVNEVLLNEHLIKNATSRDEKIFYLNNALENIRTTFFRQVQFAEFELKMHQQVENDQPLTGKKISEIYGEVIRHYYGHEKGVVTIDPEYFIEWAYVGHFYVGFYVYKYATSMAGAYYYAEKILQGDTKVRDQFIDLLAAGGSNYPHKILVKNGLDLTKQSTYQPFFRIANSYLDRLEKLLEEK